LLALASIGLSLVYGTTGLSNFAHAEQVTLGGLLAYTFANVLGLNIFLATAIVVVVAGFTGSAFHTALMASRRRAELVHFARFTAANDKTFELCAAAAGYPSQFHDCFLGFLPAPPAGTSAFAAALEVRQDFTAVRRILHDSGV
jgi:branched-subunit amino acid ABC-type transport system permease component